MSNTTVPRRTASRWPILAAVLLLLIAGAGVYLWRPVPAAPPAAPASAQGPAIPSAKLEAAAVPAAAPAPVAAPVPAAPPPPIAPTFDIVRVTPDGGAVIAGRATPGAQVRVMDGDRLVGSGKADRNGEFVIVPGERLPAGGRQLTLAAREADGREQVGPDSVIVMVPERRPAEPSAPAPAETQQAAGPQPQLPDAAETPRPAPPAPALALLVPPDAPPRLLQPPPAAGKDQLALNTVDYDDHGNIRFSGAGKPTAPVRVYVDNSRAGDAKADASGQWTMTPPDTVASGLHQLRIDQLGADGRVVARVELPFQRSAPTQETLTPGQLIVQPRQNLWRIARASYGQGTRYTLIYLANREQIRNPNLIYPGQVLALPTD